MLSIRLRHNDLANYDVVSRGLRQTGGKALLAVSSMLDGIFGSAENRHISAWSSVKVTDRSEEVEEDGTIIQREHERFANELTLVYASGKAAVLR